MAKWEKIVIRGKVRYVQRDEKGRFKKWAKEIPKPRVAPAIPRVRPKRAPERGFYYDARIRVMYISKKPNKSRAGAIAIRIKSRYRLSYREIYNIALEEAQKRDNWVTYVQPNRVRFLHLFEEPTIIDFSEDYIVDEFDFEDLRGW